MEERSDRKITLTLPEGGIVFEATLLAPEDLDGKYCPRCGATRDWHREPKSGTSMRNLLRLFNRGKLCPKWRTK